MIRRELEPRVATRLSPQALRRFVGSSGGEGQPGSDELRGVGLSWRQCLKEFVGSQTPVAAVMSHDAVSVRPETRVEGLTAFLIERGLSEALVTSDSGALVGVVTTAGLLREVQDREATEERIPLRVPGQEGVQMELGDGCRGTCLTRATVGEIMTPSTYTLPETTSVARAAAFMAFAGVSYLPVACSRCKGACIVSALDVMAWLARQSGFLLVPPIKLKGEGHASGECH